MLTRMDRNSLQILYQYGAYAHTLVLDTAKKMTPEELTRPVSPSHGSVLGLLRHVLECEAYFLTLCQGKPFPFAEEELSTLPALCQHWETIQQLQMDFLAGVDDALLARQIDFQMRDTSIKLPMWQLLLQATLHSIHHRGELSVVMTGLGYPLPTLDIILQHIQQAGAPPA